MCSSVVVLFLGLLTIGFSSATSGVAGVSPAILNQVISEQMMSRYYTDLILNMKHIMHATQSGQIIVHMTSLALAPEDEAAEGLNKKDMINILDLHATLNAWNDLKASTYLAITGAEEVQRDFYMDRIVQLQLQSLGTQVPAQIYPLIYMKFYLSYLKTMSFSLRFQVFSHMTTWFEDEIDVYSVLVSKAPHAHQVAEIEEPNMIQNKVWAFSTLGQKAQTDLTIFYIQYYLDYMTMSLSGQQGGFPDMWSRFLGLYKTLYVQTMSQAGLQHCVLAKASLEHRHTDSHRSAEEGRAATQVFGFFGHNYRMSAQMDYMSLIFKMYAMYAPYYAAAAQQQQQAAPQTTTPTTP